MVPALPRIARVGRLLALAAVMSACSPAVGPAPVPTLVPTPVAVPVPTPTCGGIEIGIPGALPCDRVVDIALQTLRRQAPAQLARGVISIDAQLASCPQGEMPPQVDCTGAEFAQLVTVVFGPAGTDVPIEPSLTVAIEPVSGRVLGIVNPLIR